MKLVLSTFLCQNALIMLRCTSGAGTFFSAEYWLCWLLWYSPFLLIKKEKIKIIYREKNGYVKWRNMLFLIKRVRISFSFEKSSICNFKFDIYGRMSVPLIYCNPSIITSLVHSIKNISFFFLIIVKINLGNS